MRTKNMDINNKKKYYSDVKNVRQWFYSTKERCDSLKSHMNYMKMLYHDMPKIQETQKTLHDLNWQDSKIKVSNNDHENVISTQTDCNNSLKEYSSVQYNMIHKDEPFVTSNLANVTSDSDLQQKHEEKQGDLNKKEGTEIELSSITPLISVVPQSTDIESRSLLPFQKENMVQCDEHNHNWKFPYQKHLTEYSTELIENNESSSKSFEQLILDNQNGYLFQESSPMRDIKLNISHHVKNKSMDKNKFSAKNEKKERAISSALSSKKDSSSKLDDIVSVKIKKRRRKIHCSNSRSTVTTRDTTFLGKKDTKRRKQKNNISSRHTFKSQQTSNEVVEIYHNAAAKSGSTSAIPSKHSKHHIEHHMNYINILTSSAMNKQQSTPKKSKCEDNNYQDVCNADINNPENDSQKYQIGQKTIGRNTIINDLNNDLKVSTIPVCTMENYNSHQCQHTIMQASYFNPIVTHNYEMPTLASKLKRANRSYFGRFNFRNIPFVVGTSITPSHNLGLNIQQVLSIMKTRQISATGATPLLIRKISRGMKPASILIEQINDQQSKLPHMNSRIDDMHAQKENLFMNKGDHLLENENMLLKYNRKGMSNLDVNSKSTIEQYQSLPKEISNNENKYEDRKKKDTRSENQLNRLNIGQVLRAADNKMLKLFASQQNVNAKIENSQMQPKTYQDNICNEHISNTSTTVNYSQNSKGIREVLINLHDQFEEMNMKYERLQAKAKKYSDKDLEQEVLHLEKELSIKEDEINAVVNLYKEVMALKQQMRSLQKKDSYVCISTEIPLRTDKMYAAMPFMSTRSNGSNFQQRSIHRRGNSVIAKEPISFRLAGLLRQIQTFQNQLKLTS